MLTKAQLQRLRSLRDKKQREALGLFVVEGEKVVRELVAAGFPLLEIYATDTWAIPDALQRNAASTSVPRITRISSDDMARASHFPTASPVLAIGRVAVTALPADGLNLGLTLALDGVQDAGNVGTLLRIADWFGFQRVVLSLDCADVFHQKVINASMGSFARITTYRTDLASVLSRVAPGVPILGCELHGSSVYTVRPTTDAIVVIGSEGRGLSASVSPLVTGRVTIPRFGQAESLNAAVAAAIVCAQLRRPEAV